MGRRAPEKAAGTKENAGRSTALAGEVFDLSAALLM